MPNTGLNAYIGFEPEVSWGVDPAGTPEWLRIASENLRFRSERTRGARELGLMTPAGVRTFNKRTEGDVVVDPRYRGIELPILDFFGAVNTTGVGPYTHVFTPSLTRQVGLTARMQQDALLSIITGLKVTALGIEATQEALQLTFGLNGKVGSQSVAATTPSYVSAPPVLPLDSPNGFTYLLDSVSECVQSARVNCALPHNTGRICVGDPNAQEPIINDYLSIEGEIVRENSDDSYEDLFQADSAHVLELNYQSADDIAAHPGNKWELKIKLFAVKFTEAKAPTDGPAELVETIPFVAEADASDNIMSITMITDRATVP